MKSASKLYKIYYIKFCEEENRWLDGEVTDDSRFEGLDWVCYELSQFL